MSADLLMNVAASIANGRIKVIDLTQTLRPATPVIALPPPLANSNPFRITEISHYDDRGPAWYWNNLSMGEHTGTHFDAPVHWVTGQHNPDGFTDTIPVRRLIAPAARPPIRRPPPRKAPLLRATVAASAAAFVRASSV